MTLGKDWGRAVSFQDGSVRFMAAPDALGLACEVRIYIGDVLSSVSRFRMPRKIVVELYEMSGASAHTEKGRETK